MDAARISPQPALVQNRHCAADEIGAAYVRLAIPIDLLDVGSMHREAVTALGAACLQNPAPVLCFHTLAEAVYTQTATFLRLPGSFDHVLLILRTNSKPRQRGA